MALQIQRVGLLADKMKRSTRARRQENMLNSLSEEESCLSVTSSSYASGSEDSFADKETSVKENAAHVYSELTTIRDKLHDELQRLKERETQLAEREKSVLELEQLARAAHDRLTQFAEEEVTRRWTQLEERMQKESQQLSDALKEKCRENKRLHNSFDSIKQVNSSLRQQLEMAQQRNDKLEAEISSVQARLTNLQRKQELQSARQTAVTINTAISQHNAKLTTSPVKSKEHRKVKLPLGDDHYFELLAVLLGWLCDDQLCKTGSPTPLVTNNCTKVLPIVATLIPNLHTTSTQTQLPVLKFIYLSILQLNTIGKQKSSLTTTLRRIGEELHKPCTTGTSCKVEQSEMRPFFQSSDLHIRLLSSLIILQTISQVDYLAITFDMIKQDLKDDVGKEAFLLYHGVSAILCFLKPAYKVLCEHTADIFLLLSMESVTLQLFLNECSTDEWFATCVNLFREAKNVGVKVLEKMSIVLQRLSKVKSNRRRFEQSHLIPVIQKLSGTLNDSDTAFLTLNLRSVILNLNK